MGNGPQFTCSGEIMSDAENNPLSFVTTIELVDEIRRRHSCLVIIDDEHEESATVYYSGGWFVALGFAHYASVRLLEWNRENQPKEEG